MPDDTHGDEISKLMEFFEVGNCGIQKTGSAQTLCGEDMDAVTGRIFAVPGLQQHSHRGKGFEQTVGSCRIHAETAGDLTRADWFIVCNNCLKDLDTVLQALIGLEWQHLVL